MAFSNAELQARWRARHRTEILARRDADRARTAAAMVALEPWTAELKPIKALADGLARISGGTGKDSGRSTRERRAAIFRVFVTRGRYADEFFKRRLPSVRAALFC
jgi:hypothetical protein